MSSCCIFAYSQGYIFCNFILYTLYFPVFASLLPINFLSRVLQVYLCSLAQSFSLSFFFFLFFSFFLFFLFSLISVFLCFPLFTLISSFLWRTMSRNVVQEYDTWGANGNGTFANDSKVASKTPYIKSIKAQTQKVCFLTCALVKITLLLFSFFSFLFLFFCLFTFPSFFLLGNYYVSLAFHLNPWIDNSSFLYFLSFASFSLFFRFLFSFFLFS